ncbi:MAG: RluA family pseudouridine synthase [Proteobacteria bacterium]|nr:RluA family pseudouridine synthase [Pseudomonadota bacterium]MCP4921023.1 RluA family pseudouridine synthase [Pseudomonadota bacterium]
MSDPTEVLATRRERLDKLLVRELPDLSRSRIKALIENGDVTVEGQVRKVSFKTQPGMSVRVQIPDLVRTELVAQDLDLEILYQDADVVVVYKPAGMVVHPSKGHSDGTLVNGLLFAIDDLSGIGGEERPGIVHRLDKGTSGVMIVAKHDTAHRHLKEQFSAHTTERVYQALVLGAPDLKAGRIDTWIGRDPRDRLRQAVVPEGRGRRAVTHWTLIERFFRSSMLECRLETGRTHQVRVHLSSQGWPILGDPLYRDRQTPTPSVQEVVRGLDHQMLHARLLGFEHPRTGERMSFTHEPPEDFQRVLEGLRAIEA